MTISCHNLSFKNQIRICTDIAIFLFTLANFNRHWSCAI